MEKARINALKRGTVDTEKTAGPGYSIPKALSV